MKRRVVITGMGAISPIGNSAEELWSNAEAGVCGIGPVTEYDSTGMKVQVAAEVKDFDPTGRRGIVSLRCEYLQRHRRTGCYREGTSEGPQTRL